MKKSSKSSSKYGTAPAIVKAARETSRPLRGGTPARSTVKTEQVNPAAPYPSQGGKLNT